METDVWKKRREEKKGGQGEGKRGKGGTNSISCPLQCVFASAVFRHVPAPPGPHFM